MGLSCWCIACPLWWGTRVGGDKRHVSFTVAKGGNGTDEGLEKNAFLFGLYVPRGGAGGTGKRKKVALLFQQSGGRREERRGAGGWEGGRGGKIKSKCSSVEPAGPFCTVNLLFARSPCSLTYGMRS